MRSEKEPTFEEFKKLPLREKIIVVYYAILFVFLLGSLLFFFVVKDLREENRLIAERKAILDRYNWDEASKEELLRRVMLYSNLAPEELGRYFPRQELGSVFLKNIHDFNEEKRKLWINYLNIPEEEVLIYLRRR